MLQYFWTNRLRFRGQLSPSSQRKQMCSAKCALSLGFRKWRPNKWKCKTSSYIICSWSNVRKCDLCVELDSLIWKSAIGEFILEVMSYTQLARLFGANCQWYLLYLALKMALCSLFILWDRITQRVLLHIRNFLFPTGFYFFALHVPICGIDSFIALIHRLEQATGLSFRFVIGRSKDVTKMARLQKEVDEYKDFMLIDVEEEYLRLPYKT